MHGLVVTTIVGEDEVKTVTARQHFLGATPPVYAHNKGVWLPFTETRTPITDAALQRQLDPVEVIEADHINIVYGIRDLNEAETAQLKQEKMGKIKARFEAETLAPIEYTLDNSETKLFDADAIARSRISPILTFISLVPAAVPNPRPWTAYGEVSPTNLTHDDFQGIAIAIAAREDAKFVVKKTKEYLLSLISDSDPEAVIAFDTESGW